MLDDIHLIEYCHLSLLLDWFVVTLSTLGPSEQDGITLKVNSVHRPELLIALEAGGSKSHEHLRSGLKNKKQ